MGGLRALVLPKPIPHIDADWFWRRVDREGPTQPHMPTPCWVWRTGRDRTSYVQVRFKGGPVRVAHRIAWMLTTGEDPGALLILHRCDTPRCVRPDHLFIGTQSDNMRDCVAKGRTGRPVRPKAPRVKPVRPVYTAERAQAVADRLRAQAGNNTHILEGAAWFEAIAHRKREGGST